MIKPEVLVKGLDNVAFERLLFRLDFIEKSFQKRIKTLEAGNLASPYPELILLSNITADLCNTVKELVLLSKISQQEQGSATPLNTDATVTETPVTPPNPA